MRDIPGETVSDGDSGCATIVVVTQEEATVDALQLTPTLRAVVCNIELPPAVRLDRQLARLLRGLKEDRANTVQHSCC